MGISRFYHNLLMYSTYTYEVIIDTQYIYSTHNKCQSVTRKFVSHP